MCVSGLSDKKKTSVQHEEFEMKHSQNEVKKGIENNFSN